MKETTQQYIQRLRGYVGDKKPVDILASTPRSIAQAIKGATRRKLTQKPSPDAWSVAEILAHLADAEIVQCFRIRLVLEANKMPIQGYNQDKWAKFSNYPAQDPAGSLECFRINRERNVRFLKSLPGNMWKRYGLHSERGKETLTRMVELMAGHDVNHLTQIRRLLK